MMNPQRVDSSWVNVKNNGAGAGRSDLANVGGRDWWSCFPTTTSTQLPVSWPVETPSSHRGSDSRTAPVPLILEKKNGQ